MFIFVRLFIALNNNCENVSLYINLWTFLYWWQEELLLRYNLMLDDVIQPKLSRMFYNVPIPEVL